MGELIVHPRPSDSLPPAFDIRAGQTFDADSSLVRITRFGVAVLKSPWERYAPGDTITITSFCAEGYCEIWWHGHRSLERPLWDLGPRSASPANLVIPVQGEWWLHVRLAGRRGWILMSDWNQAKGVDCS